MTAPQKWDEGRKQMPDLRHRERERETNAHAYAHREPSSSSLIETCFSGEKVKWKQRWSWWNEEPKFNYLNFSFSPNSFQYLPSKTGQERKRGTFFFHPHSHKPINRIYYVMFVKGSEWHEVSSVFIVVQFFMHERCVFSLSGSLVIRVH